MDFKTESFIDAFWPGKSDCKHRLKIAIKLIFFEKFFRNKLHIWNKAKIKINKLFSY